MRIRELILVLSLALPSLSAGQTTNLEIDGIRKEVTFVDNGVDFNKTFVIIGDQFKPWENAFMLAGIQVGTYYYDAKKNSNIISGDYAVKIDAVPTWAGTLTITDIRSKKVVGRIIIQNNWRFFHMPKPKHTSAQTRMLVAIKNL
jgi:hypothetical protein